MQYLLPLNDLEMTLKTLEVSKESKKREIHVAQGRVVLMLEIALHCFSPYGSLKKSK